MEYRSDLASFFMCLQAFTGVELPRRDSLIVFDEAQRFPPAREFIKQPGTDAFFRLSDAFISSTCLSIDDPSVGLAASANDSLFKCYMADTGLLVLKLFADNEETPHEVYRDILLGKLEINEGMFTENVVAQQLTASGHGLYFYSKRDREDSSNTMEIDFLVTAGYDNAAGRMRVSPVEVKSTKRYGAKSLEKFKTKFGSRVGARYILHPKPMSVDGDLVRLPLYMAHLL